MRMRHAEHDPKRDPRLTKLKTIARSLKLWVLELVLWVAALTEHREAKLWLREEIRSLRADIRLLLVSMVGLQLSARCAEMPTCRDARTVFNTGTRFHLRQMRRLALRGVTLHTLPQIKRALSHMEAIAAQCVETFRKRIVADTCDAPVAEDVGDVGEAYCNINIRPEAADTS